MANKQSSSKSFTIIFLLIIAVLVGGYVYLTYFFKNPLPDTVTGTASSTPVSLSLGQAKQLLKTVTVKMTNLPQSVTLVNGMAEFAVEDTPIKGSIVLGNVAEVRGTGSRTDVLVTMVVDYGGSGNFVYLVLFENQAGTLVQKSYALLGDRIKVNQVEVVDSTKNGVDYLVKVNILDRTESEPMAAVPTVTKILNYSVKAGQLTEIKPVVTTPSPVPTTPPTGPIACTMDAKMCPDGSYVGRSGPNCEFKCPVSATPTTSKVILKLNQPYEVGNTTIKVTSVNEDSRCPSNVQCILAGRVRIGLDLKTDTVYQGELLEVGQTTTNQAETVSVALDSVTPYPISTHKITSDEYRFSFTIKTK